MGRPSIFRTSRIEFAVSYPGSENAYMQRRHFNSENMGQRNLCNRFVSWRPGRISFLGLALASSIGCNSRAKTFPVDGKVVYEDGSTVSGGAVEFLGKTP